MTIDLIRASNGSGEAVRSVVTSPRTIGSTTLNVDSLTNYNTKFICTSGDLLADGTLDPATVTVFYGTKNVSQVIIDGFAPGYSDLGNTVGQVVVCKPTTAWADNVADTLAVTLNNDGTLKTDIVTTAKILNSNVTTAKIADDAVTMAKIFNPFCFYAYHNTTQSLGNSAEATLSLNTASLDPSSGFAASTYTVPAGGTGLWMLTGGWSTASASVTRGFAAVLTTPGNYRGDDITGTAIRYVRFSILVPLTAGDTINLRGFQTSGGSTTLLQDSTFLSGTLIRT